MGAPAGTAAGGGMYPAFPGTNNPAVLGAGMYGPIAMGAQTVAGGGYGGAYMGDPNAMAAMQGVYPMVRVP